ncbi:MULTISPECIES: hypothetical protein [unclassified Mesorhizobium]|uniref:hypothetical protein n=1 Tax=unclassified Mesorhizobium TaxID=325217 RepID=UPI0003CF36B3|nr:MULTISPECIES: hypothetical protein [unclassified Mesorhizobium]ESY46583.1 hypothetical protein X746_16625 [Mesorhizobium sp. LNJC380A00]ESX12570.1 hypothetical protein X768_07795 [Mesorhizobium sp. LSJC265A00]ESY00632.1 hypothetical protein X753_29170 [Mesorhizobium sp. LNJC399B00]ESY21408.1 hypothetical protein X750_15635 [Mesorhizobium sp. LNJC394B00]ESZ37481.1 hypothetical protein X733_00570 [Mesorhizobium sp. L2C067A000]
MQFVEQVFDELVGPLRVHGASGKRRMRNDRVASARAIAASTRSGGEISPLCNSSAKPVASFSHSIRSADIAVPLSAGG